MSLFLLFPALPGTDSFVSKLKKKYLGMSIVYGLPLMFLHANQCAACVIKESKEERYSTRQTVFQCDGDVHGKILMLQAFQQRTAIG
jgi:hypothetical protein